MSDDLDDLLRRTMKTLDDQVPSGYFEGLPDRALARLGPQEGSSMQTSMRDQSSGTSVPPQDRDEDSGLHDIRSMASSAKMRISSKRITTNPPVDDDILATSSGSWKAVALPEPAKMVSLPEIPMESEPAPSSERKSKKELKAERTSAKKIAQEAISVETAPVSAAISPAPVAKVDVPVAPIIGARFAQKAQAKQKSKAGLYALLGTGLAAAAGVGWYVSTQMKSDAKSAAPAGEQVAMQTQPQPVAAPTTTAAAGSAAAVAATPPAEPAMIAASEDKPVDTGMAMNADSAEPTGGTGDASKRGQAKPGAAKTKKDTVSNVRGAGDKLDDATIKKQPDPKDKLKGGDEGKETKDGNEPSFDALLKEAGVPQDKKVEKVALEKKSLSSADIKKGMSGVGGKAQGCYAGTQGTAQVKLTVTADGKVQKVSVTGVFAGTPVGTCVENAVKNASFPAWDGGPQSFGYSYLLAE